MTPISNEDALPSYESYDLQWLGPIVFPLSFAVPAIAYTLFKIARDGTPTHAAGVFGAGITVCEAIFAVCCLIQCIANFASRSFSGGEDACRIQGFYATFYLFSSMPLAASASLATAGRVTSCRSASLLVAASFALGLLFAAFPLMGAGEYK